MHQVILTEGVVMKFIRTLALILAVTTAAAAADDWKMDRSHSSIGFSVKHLVISDVAGQFKDFDLKLTTAKEDFSDLALEGTIKTASITTDNDRRDSHLKSDDFFNAEKFPAIAFKSTSTKKVGDNQFKVEGDLTIRDVTKRVTWDVTYAGSAKAWGKTISAWKASLAINRFDYNLKWDKTIEAGGLVVGEMVTISVNAEFAK
jgi:polyisoprenoid-binding protein YceI